MEHVSDTAIGTETAPAPSPEASAAPTPLTPAEEAVNRGDFLAFKRERHKERFPSKPDKTTEKPPVVSAESKTAEPPAADVQSAPTTEPRTLSKRQQEQNDRTIAAVDRATAALQREIAELRGQLAARPSDTAAAPKSSSAPTVDPSDPEPDPAQLEKYPDGQFDRAYMRDLAAWQTRQALNERDAQLAARDRHAAAVQQFTTRSETQKARVADALKADPTALDGIDPRLASLEPSIALAPGARTTFGNIVADWILDSEHPVALMRHLSDKAEQARLSNLPPLELLREQGRIEARLAAAASPAPAQASSTSTEPSITKAAEPPHTLGKRPAEAVDPIHAALSAGDFQAYKNAKRAKGVLHFAG